MIVIFESWTRILFNRLFYDESIVSTTSVRLNFRENVTARFTNYDRKRKLHVIQKRQAIWSVCRTINGCEYMMLIKVLRYLPVAQTRIQRRETDDQLR